VQGTDAAGHHHAQKKPLLLDTVAIPYQCFEERPGEPAAELPELFVAFLSVKNGVHSLQSPALVHYDVVVEEAAAVENEPSIVQVIKQIFGGTDHAFLVAQLSKVLLADRAVA
jgi:hypothetical protein